MKRHTTRHVPASTLTALLPFTTAGALEGRDYNPGYRGHLSGQALNEFYTDTNRIDYVVLSYSTPIAWHTPDGWTRVVDSFSVTTGKHQSALHFGVEPVREVGFRRGLSSAQMGALYELRDADKAALETDRWITPTGQARRTFAILQERGYALQDGFNPGEYRIHPDTLARLA